MGHSLENGVGDKPLKEAFWKQVKGRGLEFVLWKEGMGLGYGNAIRKGRGDLFISRASLCMSFPVLYALALFKDAW